MDRGLDRLRGIGLSISFNEAAWPGQHKAARAGKLRLWSTSGRLPLENDDRLDASLRPADMELPGYRFHPLKGNRLGECAVSVSGNWRITFRFDGPDTTDVNLEDYH